MTHLSRRRFLSDSAIAAAALSMGSGFTSTKTEAAPNDATPSANDKLNVMICGVNGRGGVLAGSFGNNPECRVKYICDVDDVVGPKKIDAFEKRFGYRPEFVRDLRKGIEDKRIDAVALATPNHWHALAGIWAMQAGKDVYVEKPVSHNISEGRRLIEAAGKYKRICQAGTQSRSLLDNNDAIDYVKSGKIGEVKLARAVGYRERNAIGAKGVYQPPKSVNYSLWTGPTEMLPITRPHFHYDWHWQYHWGNGDINNIGVHLIDVARWGLGIDSLCDSVLSYGGRLGYVDAGDTANTQVSIFRHGDKTLVDEVRGLKSDPVSKVWIGNIFYGTEGLVALSLFSGKTRGFATDLDGNVVKRFDKGNDFNGAGRHIQNFVDAVKSRNPDDLNADIREGHLSAGFGHVATTAYRLGKPATVDEVKEAVEAFGGDDDNVEALGRTVAHLKKHDVDLTKTPLTLGPVLTMDTKTEIFIDNPEADAMLTREYRKGFEVPKAGEV